MQLWPVTSCIINASNWREPANCSIKSFLFRTTFGNDHLQLVENIENDRNCASSKRKCDRPSPWKTVNVKKKKIALFSILAIKKVIRSGFKSGRIGLFFKYDPEIGKWSQNPENHNLWGRVDRYDREFDQISLKNLPYLRFQSTAYDMYATCVISLCQFIWKKYFPFKQTSKAQNSLHSSPILPEPSLLAHTVWVSSRKNLFYGICKQQRRSSDCAVWSESLLFAA